jgi:hypothetical protein
MGSAELNSIDPPDYEGGKVGVAPQRPLVAADAFGKFCLKPPFRTGSLEDRIELRGSRGRGQFVRPFRGGSRHKNLVLILLRTGHGGRPGGLALPSLCPIQQLVECRAQILAAWG